MKAARNPDWFLVDWRDVWMRLGIRPNNMPGVQATDDKNFFRVHRTHLAILGYDIPHAGPVLDNGIVRAGSPFQLRPHQIDGIRFIRTRRGTLLADEMRVGKTATTLYSHEPDHGVLFIVGPLAARAVWHEWAARRFDGCLQVDCSICQRVAPQPLRYVGGSFLALAGRRIDERTLANLRGPYPPRVIFCHFAIIQTWRALFSLLKIGTLVVDECHLPQAGMQNRKSLTSDSIRFLNTVSKRTIMLSGSPLWNMPAGLWPILDTINPGAWGDYWDFARRYCDAKPTAYGWQANGSSNESELMTRLGEVMLRRRWIDIATNLPPITRSIEIVALSNDRKDAVEDAAGRLRSQSGNAQTVIGALARLRKLYAKEKCQAAIQRALEARESGRSVIVWTHHREACAAIYSLLTANGCAFHVTGDMGPAIREQVIVQARVEAARQPVMFVATMGALATAVDLSFAEVEIFAELDWNPDSIAQAEMRPYDGTRPIQAVFLVADVDVEQRLADALLAKLEVKSRLGVSAGVGDVAEVLRASLGIENTRTLSDLADAVLAEIE